MGGFDRRLREGVGPHQGIDTRNMRMVELDMRNLDEGARKDWRRGLAQADQRRAGRGTGMAEQNRGEAPGMGVAGMGEAGGGRNRELSDRPRLVGLLDGIWHPAFAQAEPRTYGCTAFGVCLAGTGRVTLGRRTWPFSPGTVVIVPRGVACARQDNGRAMNRWRVVLVDERTLGGQEGARTPRSLPDGLCIGPEGAPEDIRENVDALFRRAAQAGKTDDAELDALLRKLMARVLELPPELLDSVATAGAFQGAIEPALLYVAENYAQEIRVEDLADSCAMSESYFRKVFIRVMGMPPLEYVNRYRVNRSTQLLRATDYTVLAIAGMAGFPSIATYNRNFRRYMGTSPAQWRKNAHG